MAKSIRTPELIAKIKELRDLLPLSQLAKECNISYASLVRIIKAEKIILSKAGKKRATDGTRKAHLGKTPWNHGKQLSEETKAKISIACSGERNGQYGRGMTEVEKVRWRQSFYSNGVHKLRELMRSDIARQQAVHEKLRSPQYRLAASNKGVDLVIAGKIRTNRGRGSIINSIKGGTFRTKSTYETRYVAILDADPHVVGFEYEPLRIRYEWNGCQLYYIPDFLVQYDDRSEELVEVKPLKLTTLPKNQAKISAGQAFCPTFRVVTEEDLHVV